MSHFFEDYDQFWEELQTIQAIDPTPQKNIEQILWLNYANC